MVQTRSATSSPVKKIDNRKPPSTATNSGDTNSISSEPLKLIVGPEDISSDARFLLLRHPRDSSLRRFLLCPFKGVYELTRVSTPAIDLRSIICTSTESLENEDPIKEGCISQGYINKSAEYMTATPFDLIFLLIPILTSGKNRLFQSMDDLFETEESENKHFSYLSKTCPRMLSEALDRICDSVEAGDEKMFRYNEEKTLKLLLSKAEVVVSQGLPKSMEERFVTRPLEMPLLSVKREDSSISLVTTEENTNTPISADETMDSQSSITSSTVSAVFSEASMTSTTATSVIAEEETNIVPADVIYLQRLHTAFKFILSLYLPSDLASNLESCLKISKALSIDWTPLDARLSRIAAARAEAAASRSLGDYSRKRGNIEDDEDALANAEARAEKKRRLEEEEKKKKANLSRGVRDLAKVDVKGMKKMSDFFSKKPPSAAVKTKT